MKKMKLKKLTRAASALMCMLLVLQPCGGVFATAADTAADDPVSGGYQVQVSEEILAEEQASDEAGGEVSAPGDMDEAADEGLTGDIENVADETDADDEGDNAVDTDGDNDNNDNDDIGGSGENGDNSGDGSDSDNAGGDDSDNGDDSDDEPTAPAVNYSWYICAGAESAESYTIADAASLKGLANLVNGTDLPEGVQTVVIEDGTEKSAVLRKTDFAGKTVTLINDINMSDVCGPDGFDENGARTDSDGGISMSWRPVGGANAPFAGTFNGNGRQITGLYISSDTLSESSYIGLFGCVTGTLKNVSVNGCIDVAAVGADVDVYAGMLAGALYGSALNVKTSGSINAGSGTAGGIAGDSNNDADIKYSYNTAEISAARAAGLITGAGSVYSCFNTGRVSGSEEAGMVVLSSVAAAPTEGESGVSAVKNCFALTGCVAGSIEPADSNVVTAADAEAFVNGSVAWRLNTASGSAENEEAWTQAGDMPGFAGAEKSAAPVYRMTAVQPAGVEMSVNGVLGREELQSEPDKSAFYFLKGQALTLKAAPVSAGDGSSDEDISASVYDLAYMTVKDSAGKLAFSAYSKKFSSDGISLECSPQADMLTADLELYKDAEPGTKVTVTFDASGGCFGGDEEKTEMSEEYKYGSVMSDVLYDIDDPTRGADEFNGWFMDKECRIPADGNALLIGDTTLYAGWIKQCVITFELNGYGGSEDVSEWPLRISAVTGSPVDSQTVPMWVSTDNGDGTLTRHNFAGWFTEAEGGVAWNFDDPVQDDMTLYAHWTEEIAKKSDSSSGGGVTNISGGESFQKLLGTIQDGVSYAGQTITFDSDIELQDAVSISSFDGILDGQGYTLKLNRKQFTSTGSMTALFRTLKKDGAIKNLNIVYDDGGSFSSTAKFAVLCDTNYGTIQGCAVKLRIQKSGSSSGIGGSLVRVNAAGGVVADCALESGSNISFNGSFGGLVGVNYGEVSGCAAEKNVKIEASASAGGIVCVMSGGASSAEKPGTGSDSKPGSNSGKDDSDKDDSNKSDGKNDGKDDSKDDNGNGSESAGGTGSGENGSDNGGQDSNTGSDGENGGNTGNDNNDDNGSAGDENGSGPAAVRNCVSHADITADMSSRRNSDKSCAGGIAATVIAGADGAVVEKCYSTGSVSGLGAAGGIVGSANGFDGNSEAECIMIDSCYSAGSVKNAAAVGGVVGTLRAGTVTGCYSTAELTGAAEYLGGIAGAGPDGKSYATSDSECAGAAAGSAVINGAYWFGSKFSAEDDASVGMFCGGRSDDITLTGCYFGSPDDSELCKSDAHMSGEEQTSAVRTAAEFADGSVAWDLETAGGQNKIHLRKFSMNTKPAESANGSGTGTKASSGSAAGSGSDGNVFVITGSENYSSPVLSENSVYRVEASFDESTDQDVVYDKTVDYVIIRVGKIVLRAYGQKDGAGDASGSAGSGSGSESDGTGASGGTESKSVVYFYGSDTLKWIEYSSNLHYAMCDLVNNLIEKNMDDTYDVLTRCNVTITDTDGNVLEAYSKEDVSRLGFNSEFKLGDRDLKISADIFKTIAHGYEPEEDEDKKDDEQPKPSDSKHHHNSSSSSTSNGSGNGGSGTNEDATGRNDGDGLNDSGAPTLPEPTLPVISEDPDEQITIVLPTEQTAQDASDVETEEPDAAPELAQQAAPADSPDSPRNEEKKQDQSEPEQADQTKPQTVFEVIRHSVEDNPVSLIAVALMVLAIIAAAAVHRIRRDK